MKKSFLKLITMLSLVFSLFLAGCQNCFKITNNGKPKDLVTVNFCNDGFAGRAVGDSIFMPEENILARAQKFELSGRYTGTADYEEDYKKLDSQIFTQLSDLSSFTKNLVAGNWTFTLNAYSEFSESPFYADEVEVVISDTSKTVVFNLHPAVQDGGTGQLELKFNFPDNNVTKVSYMFYKVNSDLVLTPGDLGTNLEPVIDGDTSLVKTSIANLPYGNYVMLISLYSDTPQSDTFMGDFSVYFVIQTGLVTTIEKSFDNLIAYWKVILNGNGVDLKDGVSDFFYYTEYNDVILPTKSAFDETASSGKFFSGWTTSDDGSGSTLTKWQNGTVSGNITLYASWLTEPPYKVKFLDGRRDYFSGQMDEITTSGSTLNSGSISIANNPLFETTGLTLTDEDESNIPVFEGWYTKSTCESGTKIPQVDGVYKLNLTGSDELVHDDENRTVTLYAKWNYKLVYLDPENATDDSKSGFTAVNAVKTVEEAKWLTCNDVDTDVIYVMSGISETSDVQQLSNTNGIYKLHSSCEGLSDVVFKVPSGSDCRLENIVFDGNEIKIKNHFISNSSSNITFYNVKFKNFKPTYISTSLYYTIYDLSIESTYLECSFTNCSGGILSKNVMKASGNHQNRKVTINSCSFENVGGGKLKIFEIELLKTFNMLNTQIQNCSNNETLISIAGADDSSIIIGDSTGTTKNIFSGNTSNNGGLCVVPKEAKFYYCDFTENTGTGSSSSNSKLLSNANYTNCEFTKNETQTCIFNCERDAYNNPELTLTNCEFSENIVQYDVCAINKNPTIDGTCSFSKGIKLTDAAIIVGPNLVPAAGESVSTIYLNKYEVDMQVLDLTSSGTAVIPYFTISDPAYRIDENGYLTFKYSASGVIGNPFDSKVVLAVDKTTVNIDGKLLFTSKIGDNPVGLTDWFVTAEYYSIEEVALDLTDQIIDGASRMELDLNKAGIIYKGSYLFTVSGVYSGIKYSEEFLVTVE